MENFVLFDAEFLKGAAVTPSDCAKRSDNAQDLCF